jgi:hypothetical protein
VPIVVKMQTFIRNKKDSKINRNKIANNTPVMHMSSNKNAMEQEGEYKKVVSILNELENICFDDSSLEKVCVCCLLWFYFL